MKLKQTMPFILVIIFILISLRCDTNEPPQNKASLTLTLEDVSCTEAWIKLTTNNIQLPATINLLKNNSLSQILVLNTQDSLLYIDSLFPKQTYTFQVSSIQNPASSLSSNQATATTLDTTSHNFTWQTFTFGQHSSSALYDVAIINENNIWAVGEIYMKDSLGNNDPNAYNAAHWDGQSWELKRIYFPTVCGSTSLSSYPAKAIFVFNDGQIWISSSGDKIAILKDGVQINKFCLPSNVSMSINKLWGSSSNDLYAVGNGGNIAHYQNGVWTKIESSATVDLLDVWGSPDGSIVWACGYYSSYNQTVLLKYENKLIKKLYEGSPNVQINNTYVGLFDGIWSNTNHTTYFINWGGICTLNFNNINNFKMISPVLSDIGFAISASNKNNIFVAGQHGLVTHYNGSSTKEYVELRNNKDYLYGIKVYNKKVCSVGTRNINTIYNQAIIHLIKTQGD